MQFSTITAKSLTVCAALSLALVGCGGGQSQTAASNQKTEEKTEQVATGDSSQGATQTQSSEESEAGSSYISSDAAIGKATAYIAQDNTVSNAAAELKEGGDAPHYVVTFHYDDADYTVEVDAITGDVWNATDSYGTSY